MDFTLLVLLAILTFNLVWAVYTTFGKEKLMIEQGEGALPATTYGFIVLRHVVRMLIYVLAFYLLGGVFTIAMGKLKLFGVTIAIALGVEILSAVIETLVRTLYFKYQFDKMSKEDTKEE